MLKSTEDTCVHNLISLRNWEDELFKKFCLPVGPPLWSSGQRSWLQIKNSAFNSRHYQIFSEVVDLVRGPLSLASTIEGRKSIGSGLETWEYSRRDPSCWPRVTSYPQKLALTSLTSCGRSVHIVRSRTQAMKFRLFFRVPETETRRLRRWSPPETLLSFQRTSCILFQKTELFVTTAMAE
jgi:hypothetical protein